MTTTTWDEPFATMQQTRSVSMLDGILALLVLQKSSHPHDDVATEITSQGLTDDEVTQRKGIVDALKFPVSDALKPGWRSITCAPQEVQGLCNVEKAMLALIEAVPVEVPREIGADSEMLDWDMVSKLREREKRTVSVTLRYAGRRKPLADPDPWT